MNVYSVQWDDATDLVLAGSLMEAITEWQEFRFDESDDYEEPDSVVLIGEVGNWRKP